MTSLKGGVPILVDGQVVGAVGVGGGTGDQDAGIAPGAGIAHLETVVGKEREMIRSLAGKGGAFL